MINNALFYGGFRVHTFAEIWSNYEAFKTEYTESEVPQLLSEPSLKTLYYLLYAQYGNSHISNELDEEQWKYQVWSKIFMYGPTWEKKLEIQSKIRALQEQEILAGSKAIYNRAVNPDTSPSTATLTELPFISDQNTTNYVKSKLEGYATLTALLETDVTKEFIDRFKPLFKYFVRPDKPLLFDAIQIEGD